MQYTVVGINERDLSDFSCIYDASWVELIEADSPPEAAAEACRMRAQVMADSRGDEEFDESDLEANQVLAIFDGDLIDLWDRDYQVYQLGWTPKGVGV